MLTHPARLQNPEGEAAEGGAALAQGRKPKWGNRTSVLRHPQPHAKTSIAGGGQRGVEPQKGSQLHDT